MSFDLSSKKQKSKASSETDPWDVATPYIEDFLKTNVDPLITSRTTQPNSQERAAMGQLTANARAGNPYTGEIDNLTRDLFATESRAPMVESGYSDMVRRLAPTADGTNLDIMSNPHLTAMLDKVSSDARTAANETFAGAGRSFSGAHAGALGSAVADAQLPVLFNQYNMEQGRTVAAARDLFAGSQSTATTGANLDQQTAALRAMGIDTGNAALEAKNWGANTILQIQERLKSMPIEQAAKLAAILFPAGNLGQQEQGKSSIKQSGFSIGGSLFGS